MTPLFTIIISIQPLGQFGQRPELSQATGMALVCCIPDKFLGLACHCFPLRFLDIPTFATRCLHICHDTRDPSGGRWKCGRERLSGNFAEMMASTPWDRWLYFPSEKRHAENFFALKNLTASAGFEPANLGTKGQHTTPRPPKLLLTTYYHRNTHLKYLVPWETQKIVYC
jgi:hypothetical protein